MFKFELEKGSKKHTCPACSSKRFVRYVKRSTNEHLAFDVGRCDRESSCGYHFTPKMFYIQNPSRMQKTKGKQKVNQCKDVTKAKQRANNSFKTFDLIPYENLINSLRNYEQNSFVQFLLNLFPNCFDEVQKAVKDYRIGTTEIGKTIYWQIDMINRIRTGKIMAYDGITGKRIKSINPTWAHSELKKRNLLKSDFSLKQCFFGEHLLRTNPNKPICVCEAEKTAVIASICFSEFVWLAIGSKQTLKLDKLKRLGKEKIILYPDADGFDAWQKTAFEARFQGSDVSISSLIEKHGTDSEKGKGFDLADYLISQQSEINKLNAYVNIYNAKLDKVLNDESLQNDFETILDEQKAILIDRGMSDREAESEIRNFENIRTVVMGL